MRGGALFCLLLAWLGLSARAAAACPGDCDGDGAVNVAELVVAVGIALGAQAPSACPGLADGAGTVSVARLIAAVNAALDGCPPLPTASPAPPSPTPAMTAGATSSPVPSATAAPPTATATEPPTPEPTPTAPDATPSASPSATASGPNAPPALAEPFLYRGFAGQPIALPLGALDPEGGAVTCSAADLADGMRLDPDNVLRWTPRADQLGPFTLPITCRDGASPPGETDGALALHVAADDACVTPTCDAATGCTARLGPTAVDCCAAHPPRVAAYPPVCPLGRAVEVGRNSAGFGRLQNCDVLRIRTFQQAGADVALHLRVACFTPGSRISLTVRLTAGTRGTVLDGTTSVTLPETAVDGYLEKRALRFAVLGAGPYFDLEGAEGNLTVTARDPNSDVTVSRSLRVVLTMGAVSEIPD
ncbi:MAG: hypothetical protein SF182_27140 [Deltaproteobacteria bacterium]|nr:hypothetical protein [Deltaproteobacteria bacterium]